MQSGTYPRTCPLGRQPRRKYRTTARAMAMTMPWRTPSTIDPEAGDQARGRGRSCGPARTGRSASRSSSDRAALISTAASADCGRSASRELKKSSSTTTTAGADHRRQLGLGSGLLDDRGTRAAGRHGESLQASRHQVGRSDADHLLVGVDLLTPAGPETRRRGDGVGQGDEGDADRGDHERPDVGEPGPRQRRPREAAGQGAHRRNAVVVQSEYGRDDGGGDDGDQHRREASG